MSNDDKRIYDLYLKYRNCHIVKKYVPHSIDFISKKVKQLGLPIGRSLSSRMFDYEIDDMCEMYKNKVATNKIQKKYPFIKSQNVIIDIIKENSIDIRQGGNVVIIDHEDFFLNIDTEDKAYILGLLIADGYIIENNRQNGNRSPSWGISLNNNDKYIIEYIKKTIGLHTKIIHTKRNTDTIITTSKRMVNDLAKFGVVPRKSFITYLPNNIAKSLQRHLIRGFFDGNGCISNHTCTFYGVSIIIPEIKELLSKEIEIGNKKITYRKKGTGANSFSFSSSECVNKFFHYLYDDATIYMKRKYNKFLELECCNDNANTVVTK